MAGAVPRVCFRLAVRSRVFLNHCAPLKRAQSVKTSPTTAAPAAAAAAAATFRCSEFGPSLRKMSTRETESETAVGPVQSIVLRKLSETFNSSINDLDSGEANEVFIDVQNESHMHNVPRGSETHFKVVVVSPLFEGVPLLQRHRQINALLSEEMKKEGGIHALSIVAKTPQQWKSMGGAIEASPACLGGMKREQR